MPKIMTQTSPNTSKALTLFTEVMKLPNETVSKRIASKVLVALRKDFSVADSVRFCENLPDNEFKLLYAENIGVRLRTGQIKDINALIGMILVEDKKDTVQDFSTNTQVLNAAISLFCSLKQVLAEPNFITLCQFLPADFIELVAEPERGNKKAQLI